MDRSGAPWRVLDDAVPAILPQAGDPAAHDVAAMPRLSWPSIAGLIAAAAIAIGAFAIAATGPGGEITVDGGAAWTGSGAPSQAGGRVGPGGSIGAVALVIDVQGAVLHPGVLQIEHGSRVADAIAAAGGYSPRVDAERAGREVNLAAELRDGDRIVVPSRDDPTGSGTSGDGGTGTAGGLIDLNNATAEELDTLPGVGPVTAQKIIDARPFASVEDLRNRKVVGSSTFEKLQALVTVR